MTADIRGVILAACDERLGGEAGGMGLMAKTFSFSPCMWGRDDMERIYGGGFGRAVVVTETKDARQCAHEVYSRYAGWLAWWKGRGREQKRALIVLARMNRQDRTHPRFRQELEAAWERLDKASREGRE